MNMTDLAAIFYLNQFIQQKKILLNIFSRGTYLQYLLGETRPSKIKKLQRIIFQQKNQKNISPTPETSQNKGILFASALWSGWRSRKRE